MYKVNGDMQCINKVRQEIGSLQAQLMVLTRRDFKHTHDYVIDFVKIDEFDQKISELDNKIFDLKRQRRALEKELEKKLEQEQDFIATLVCKDKIFDLNQELRAQEQSRDVRVTQRADFVATLHCKDWPSPIQFIEACKDAQENLGASTVAERVHAIHNKLKELYKHLLVEYHATDDGYMCTNCHSKLSFGRSGQLIHHFKDRDDSGNIKFYCARYTLLDPY